MDTKSELAARAALFVQHVPRDQRAAALERWMAEHAADMAGLSAFFGVRRKPPAS